MGYTKRIVCLANSYKKHGTCVAGRELTSHGYGPWIRPISDRMSAEISRLESYDQHHEIPKPLDILEIAFLGQQGECHQTENHLIDGGKRWVKCGELPFSELRHLCERPRFLWSNTDHTRYGVFDCISEAQVKVHQRSLVLIANSDVVVQVGKNAGTGLRQYRARFDHAGTGYNLSIADPAIRRMFDLSTDGEHALKTPGLLYLSLSLTQPYSEDGRCHKIVAAIISDPSQAATP